MAGIFNLTWDASGVHVWMQPNGAEVLKNYIDKIIFYHDKLRFQKCLSIFTNIHGLVRYNVRLG